MECEVPGEFGIYQRIVSPCVFESRIDCLHAGIQTKQEIVEVEAYAHTV